jgi:hypothetical protein
VLEVPMRLPLNKLYAPAVDLAVFDPSLFSKTRHVVRASGGVVCVCDADGPCSLAYAAISLESFMPWNNLDRASAAPPATLTEVCLAPPCLGHAADAYHDQIEAKLSDAPASAAPAAPVVEVLPEDIEQCNITLGDEITFAMPPMGALLLSVPGGCRRRRSHACGCSGRLPAARRAYDGRRCRAEHRCVLRRRGGGRAR